MAEVAIQGAGTAGCALALFLGRQRHSLNVFERAQRSGGQAVDVRGVALKLVEGLKLIEEVRACRILFRGMSSATSITTNSSERLSAP